MMSQVEDYSADHFVAEHREKVYSTTTMLPASSQNQGEKRHQDDGVAGLVAGLLAVAEDAHRPVLIRKYSLP